MSVPVVKDRVRPTVGDGAPLLSLVVLCYRSGQYVLEFVRLTEQTLRSEGITDYELVLVANYVEGTEDSTPGIVRDLAERNPRVAYSAMPKEGWMGWDMRSGLELARGKYLAVIDGDGQMPISDVIAVFDRIRNGELDLVKTFRTTRGDGLVRKVFSHGFNFLFRVLFPGSPVRDINSKPKIFSREAYELMTLTSDDWFIDAEIILEARRLGLKIGEVSTSFLELNGRRSFINVTTVVEFLGNLAAWRVRAFRRGSGEGGRR